MKKIVVALVIICFTVLAVVGACIGFYIYDNRPDESELPDPTPYLGVWWWDNRIDSTYLDFAESYNVTDIYYYTSNFSQKTTVFIQEANSRCMDVLWLQGEYEWIEDVQSLKERIDGFLEYQESNGYPFKGIHLDIEPHQHPQFEERREELIKAFVALSKEIKDSYPNYDIPFWLEDEITYGGVTKPAYQFVIDNATRVTVMTYRDEWQKIYDAGKAELEYATSVDKPINFSVETGEEEDVVTFFEEGATYMYEQLALLRKQLPSSCGIAVHHIKSWRELKN